MRTRGLLASVAVLCLTLAGCGTPPWKEGSTAATPAPVSAAPPSTATTPSPTPTPKAAKVRNDLAKGSAKHQLSAGGVKISVSYWSTLDMASWTPEATKPLNLSLSADFTDGSDQNLFLSSVTLTADVKGAEGTTLQPPEPLVDQAPVTPGYLITSPSSYVKVFSIGEVDQGATSLTLNLTYEVLAQSAPKSKQFLKQSAGDTLVIALRPS